MGTGSDRVKTMAEAFQRIGLFTKPGAPEAHATLSKVARFLGEQGCTSFIDSTCCEPETADQLALTPLPREQMVRQIDLAIVVGGDGSFISAARSVVDHGVPLLGINLGRLGFLADFSPETLEQDLSAVLAGNYTREQRSLLHARIFENDRVVFEHLAVNDVVLHKPDTPRMIEFNAWLDDHFVTRHRSDGLIIATPTGSTAYALSAGGPLVDPRLEALLMVSINPHTLSNRPVVVPGRSVIRLVPHKTCTGTARITCDGQITFEIQSHHVTQVAAHDRKLTMIHPVNYNFYDILRTKLGWGGHSRC